ncbi:hypothetical protein BJ875DRAFT_231810 [Amylocarpus encephaloides]|uniref:Secreted protein n=1 Tax=Amylocarpus encephaloides TaxID=45428 RepID=A0A9P8BZU7_9HELO|nr:hypothetical protein BJ875DRAFT_231810 [Amylocarpus encephaloides]
MTTRVRFPRIWKAFWLLVRLSVSFARCPNLEKRGHWPVNTNSQPVSWSITNAYCGSCGLPSSVMTRRYKIQVDRECLGQHCGETRATHARRHHSQWYQFGDLGDAHQTAARRGQLNWGDPNMSLAQLLMLYALI